MNGDESILGIVYQLWKGVIRDATRDGMREGAAEAFALPLGEDEPEEQPPPPRVSGYQQPGSYLPPNGQEQPRQKRKYTRRQPPAIGQQQPPQLGSNGQQ